MFTKQIYRHRNEEKTIQQWADKFKLSIEVVRYRWKKGIRGDALFTPIPSQEEQISYNTFITHDSGDGDETKTIKEWAEEIGMNPKTLALRYYNGDRDEVLFRRKHHHRKSMPPKP